MTRAVKIEDAAVALLDDLDYRSEVERPSPVQRGYMEDLRTALSLPASGRPRSHRCIDDGGDGYECPGCHAAPSGRGYDEGWREGVEALCREFTRRYGPSSGAALRGLAATLAPSAPKGDAPGPYVCPFCGSEWQLRYEAGSSIGYCPKCCPVDERKRLEASQPAPVSQPAQPRETGGCGVTSAPLPSFAGRGVPAPRPVKNQEYNVGCIHDPFQEVGMARPCRHEAIEIAEANLGDGALPCPICDDGIQEKCPHCGREP